MFDASVYSWLSSLRSTVEEYDSGVFCFSKVPSDGFFNGEKMCDSDGGSVEEVKRCEEEYENIWECKSETCGLKYGDVRRISVLFDESVEELNISPVVFGKFEYTIPDDVVQWASELLYQCHSEDEGEVYNTNLELSEENKDNTRVPPFPVENEENFSFEYKRKAIENKALEKPQNFMPPAIFSKNEHVKLSEKKTEDEFEIKGLSWLIYGEKQQNCKGQTLKFQNGNVNLLNEKTSQKKIIEENVAIKEFRPSKNKKVYNLILTNKKIIEIKFEHSKDIRQIRERIRSDSSSIDFSPPSKYKIREKLGKFLAKRPNKETMSKTGLLQNEAIFGNSLENLYKTENEAVPVFVRKTIEIIERDYNITSLGLYRASGNLATIQKIRLDVDKLKYDVLEEYKRDTDVLTGALKLFFRELKECLIPYNVFEKLLELSSHNPEEETYPKIKDILQKDLSYSHKETLLFLLNHMLKVIKNKLENKMSVHNLAIVWGPSLIFDPDNNSENLLKHSNNANIVICLLINWYKAESGKVEPITEINEPNEITTEENPQLIQDTQTEEEICSSLTEQFDNFETELESSKALHSDNSDEEKRQFSGDSLLELSLEKMKRSSKSNIPEFLNKIIELIEKHLKHKNLYAPEMEDYKGDSINYEIMKKIFEKPDLLTKYKNKPYVLTGVLKIFLKKIKDPFKIGFIFEDVLTVYDKTTSNQRRIHIENSLEKILSVYKESLSLIMKHLNNVMKYSDSNNMFKENLFEIWTWLIYSENKRGNDYFKHREIFEVIFNYFCHKCNETGDKINELSNDPKEKTNLWGKIAKKIKRRSQYDVNENFPEDTVDNFVK